MRPPDAADDRRLQVERVLHVARGVVRRHVQRLEVVEVVFDFRAFEDLVAHAGEDVFDLAADTHQGMDAAERQLFLHLLTVAGIGPKVALAIVSGAPAADLRRAIVLQDAARFQAVPGVGKKTAERIVLELKEKLGAEDPVPISTAAGTSVHVTARDALVELGYSVLEAEQALASVDPDLPAEERVRLALRQAA